MKVFFDQNVPRKLRTHLARHEVETARDLGWGRLDNGKLIKAVEAACFEVFVTCDQNLSYQQNAMGRKIALVILSTNNWNIIKQKIPISVSAVDFAQPGNFRVVDYG